MIPRSQLDIRPSDLAYGLLRTVVPPGAARGDAGSPWPRGANGLVSLSVRTGFDALLTALELPAGSEVMMSAVTIADMARIIRAHGLVPVPVDIDETTLAPTHDALEAAWSSLSCMLLLAHLFGARSDFSAAIEFGRARGLCVVEDCAQAYTGDAFAGDVASDVRMFSFGPIKTRTALGGGVLCFRNATLRARVAAVQDTFPVQATSSYAQRLVKFGLLGVLGLRVSYTLFVRGCRVLGISHDDVVSRATRGFPGDALLPQIRRRPCAALVALLRRRLACDERARVNRRISEGAALAAALTSHTPATAVRSHTYWKFPVLSADRERLIAELWRAGFDATRGATSIGLVPTPPERPDVATPRAAHMMRDVLFVPVNGVAGEMARLRTAVLRDGDGVSVGAHPPHPEKLPEELSPSL